MLIRRRHYRRSLAVFEAHLMLYRALCFRDDAERARHGGETWLTKLITVDTHGHMRHDISLTRSSSACNLVIISALNDEDLHRGLRLFRGRDISRSASAPEGIAFNKCLVYFMGTLHVYFLPHGVSNAIFEMLGD